jgi:HEAT repeat protein
MTDKSEPDNLADILHALRHEQIGVREQAIERLRDYANSATSDTHDDTSNWVEAFQAWDRVRTQRLQQRGVVETLLRTMEDVSDQIRARTASLLGSVVAPGTQEALARHLQNDPSPRVRLVCAWMLRTSSASPVTVDALIAALQDPYDSVISSVCKALGECDDMRVVEPLCAVLTHSSWNVRYSGCAALVRLNAVDPSLVSLLGELNRHPEAQAHNEMIISGNELTAQYEPGSALGLTTQEMLDQARRALQ